jgi:hypothetical protein
MPKPLRDFLVFVGALILLLAAYTLGKNGSPVGAAGGIAVLVAWLFFWNRRQSAKLPQMDRVLGISAASTMPANRKAIINFLRALFVGLWLIAIVIGAGVFGRSPTLSYVFAACCVIGLGAVFAIRFITRKSQNSN